MDNKSWVKQMVPAAESWVQDQIAFRLDEKDRRIATLEALLDNRTKPITPYADSGVES